MYTYYDIELGLLDQSRAGCGQKRRPAVTFGTCSGGCFTGAGFKILALLKTAWPTALL